MNLRERGGLSNQSGKIDSATVMGLFIHSTYQRQAGKTEEYRDFMVLNTPERACFMSAVACFMAANGLPNQFAPDQFRMVAERIFESLPDEVSANVPVRSTEPRSPPPGTSKERRGLDCVGRPGVCLTRF